MSFQGFIPYYTLWIFLIVKPVNTVNILTLIKTMSIQKVKQVNTCIESFNVCVIWLFLWTYHQIKKTKFVELCLCILQYRNSIRIIIESGWWVLNFYDLYFMMSFSLFFISFPIILYSLSYSTRLFFILISPLFFSIPFLSLIFIYIWSNIHYYVCIPCPNPLTLLSLQECSSVSPLFLLFGVQL